MPSFSCVYMRAYSCVYPSSHLPARCGGAAVLRGSRPNCCSHWVPEYHSSSTLNSSCHMTVSFFPSRSSFPPAGCFWQLLQICYATKRAERLLAFFFSSCEYILLWIILTTVLVQDFSVHKYEYIYLYILLKCFTFYVDRVDGEGRALFNDSGNNKREKEGETPDDSKEEGQTTNPTSRTEKILF